MFKRSLRIESRILLTLGLLYLTSLGSVSYALVTAELTDICKLVKPGTKILQPGTCADWAECGLNGAIVDEGSCLEGWYYDKDSGKCGKNSTVKCGFTNQTPVQSSCKTEKTGTFLPHPEQCNGFIYCKEGVELYSQCPDGLNFQPSTQRCVYPSKYSCDAKGVETDVNEICLSVGENVRFADPKTCSLFLQCVKGVIKKVACVPGTYYSRVAADCVALDESDCARNSSLPSNISCGTDDDPTFGFISDEATCGGYYYCDEMADGTADRNPVFGKCPDGKFFDVNLSSCKDRANVRCLFDRCEGMGNQFANKQGDCSKYLYCNNGKSTQMGSCPEGYYFDEKLQSCTNQYVSYMSCVN